MSNCFVHNFYGVHSYDLEINFEYHNFEVMLDDTRAVKFTLIISPNIHECIIEGLFCFILVFSQFRMVYSVTEVEAHSNEKPSSSDPPC